MSQIQLSLKDCSFCCGTGSNVYTGEYCDECRGTGILMIGCNINPDMSVTEYCKTVQEIRRQYERSHY